MKNIFIINFITFFILLFFTLPSYGDVIIVGSMDMEKLTLVEIKEIYLGLSNLHVDIVDCKEMLTKFLAKYIKKSKKAYNRKRLTLLFTEGIPIPTKMNTSEDVIKRIKNSTKTLGYVSNSVNLSGVKILLK